MKTIDYLKLHKFFYLLVSLIAYFIGISIVNGRDIGSVLISVIFSMFIAMCILTINQNRFVAIYMIFLGLVSVIGHWFIVLFNPGVTFEYVFYISQALFLIFNTISILHVIINHKEITTDTIFGAITGYLLLGVTWAYLFIIISFNNPHAFSKGVVSPYFHQNTLNFFYFSFSTMTTIGFGDFLPMSNLARTASWVEAIMGQVYLTVWITQLVGLRISQRNHC